MSPSGDAGAGGVEQLLLKFGLDLSPMKNAAAAIKAALEELNRIADETASKAGGAVQGAASAMQKLEMGTKDTLALQKQQTDELQKQVALTSAQAQAQAKADTVRIDSLKRSASEAAKAAEHVKKSGGGEGGGEGEGGFLSQVGKGLVGKFGGQMGTALLAGGAAGIAEAASEKAIELIENIVEKLKEAIEEAGQFDRIWRVIDATIRGTGGDAVETLDKWQEATEGTINQLQLLKTMAAASAAGLDLQDPKLEAIVNTVFKAGEVYSSAGRALAGFDRFMETGNARVLLMATGLSRQAAVITKELVPAYNEAADRMRTATLIKEMLDKRLSETEGGPKSFAQTFEHLAATVENEFINLARGFQNSAGMQIMLTSLNKVIDLLDRLANKSGLMELIGKAFGNLVFLITAGTQAILLFLSMIDDARAAIAKWWDEISKTEAMQIFIKGLQKIHDLIKPIADKITDITNKITGAKDAGKIVSGPQPESEAAKRADIQRLRMQDEYDKAVEEKSHAHQAAMLHDTQNFLQNQLQMENKHYQEGSVALEQHLINQNNILDEQRLNRRAEATNDNKKQVDDLKRQISEQNQIISKYPGTTIGGQYYDTPQAVEARAKKKILDQQVLAANEALGDKLTSIDKETDNTRNQNFDTYWEARLKLTETHYKQSLALQQSANKTEEQENEDRYSTGSESFEEYTDNKLKLLDKSQKMEEDHIAALKKLWLGYDEMQIQLDQQLTLSKAENARQRMAIIDKEGSGQIEWIKKQQQLQMEPITALQQIQAAGGAPGPGGTQYSTGSLLQAQKQVLQQAMMATMETLGKAYMLHDVSGQQQGRAQMATFMVQLAKINEELDKLADNLAHFGSILGTLSHSIGTIFTSKFAQNLSQTLGIGVQGMEAARQRNKILTQSFSDYEGEITKAGGKTSPGDRLQQFSDKLAAGIGAVTDFVAAITHATSAISGALGGGAAGAGLGGALGGGLGKLIPSLGAAGGPIGQAVGAAVGMALGAITGAKNAQVKKTIDSLNQSFQNITYALQENTNNLQQAITQLQGLIQQAMSAQAASKKGHAQFQQAIDQYNQQLHSLQVQQEGVVRSMEQQLAVLQAPLGMQSFLGQLSQIYQSYEQFLGAVDPKDINEIAYANEFLARSLDQYSISLQQQFNQANLDAVNDAIQLNDLLFQRDQLILQINQDIEGVLAQGVLTRQATRAQTAGEQIAQIKLQTGMQMEQLNAQIAATQYRVSAEQQIFNLATTRVGLELQLVQLQGVQTDQQMQQISALQNLIQQIQQGGPNVDTLLNALQLATNPGVTSGKSGNSLIDALFTAAYNSRASLGYGAYTGSNL